MFQNESLLLLELRLFFRVYLSCFNFLILISIFSEFDQSHLDKRIKEQQAAISTKLEQIKSLSRQHRSSFIALPKLP
jgi:hypothetical protein